MFCITAIIITTEASLEESESISNLTQTVNYLRRAWAKVHAVPDDALTTAKQIECGGEGKGGRIGGGF